MKHIVSLIKKMAQAPQKDPLEGLPAAPGSEPPKPTPAPAAAPAAPAWKPPWEKPGGGATGGKPVVVKNPDVVTMQQAILDFANIASSSDVTSMEGNKEGRQVGEQTRATPIADNKAIQEAGKSGNLPGGNDGAMPLEEQQKLNQPSSKENPGGTGGDKKTLRGSDAFGNFIIQNYIPRDGIGKQYTNVDVAGTGKREQAAIAPSDLRGIIDTIKRIGSPNIKGERVPDGQWGTRTNNSLHLIGDLIHAMLNFTKDMRVPVQGYTEQDLQDYKSKVPVDYKTLKTQADFSNAAKELIPHLRAMTEYFRFLNGKVFNNQQLRKYIDQKQSFTKYEQLPTDPNLLKHPIPINLNGQKTNIYLNNLTSMDAFRAYVNILLGNSRDAHQPEETVRKLLSMVVEQINGKVNLGI